MSQKNRGDELGILWSDPFTRRSLLRATGIGVGVLALGGASACSGGTSVREGQASRPPAGGTFSAAQIGPWNDLDPTRPLGGAIMAFNLWAETLYRIDPFPPRTKVIPELAVDLPQEVSPTTYRIRLRKGVKFHDGSPFTADDVVFTLERILDPDTGAFNLQFLNFVKRVRAVSDHEVELTLKTPTTLLAQRLALDPMISKSTPPKALARKPVGTGPYQVVSAVSGQEITFARFKGYTGTRDPGYDTVKINNVDDATARISGLRTGRFKVIEAVPLSAFKELSSANNIEAKAVDGYGSSHLFFNCAKPPFNDVRVRRAVCYAIDRDAITKSSFFGLAKPAWTGWLPEHPDFVEPQTKYRFDANHAKKLLSDAGYAGKSIPIDILISNTMDAVVAQGPVIEQNLQAVGFKPNILSGEHASRLALVQQGKFNAWLFAGDLSGPFSPALDAMLRAHFAGFVPREFMRWDGKALAKVERLLDATTSAPDRTTYRQRIAEVLEIIQDEVPEVVLHTTKQVTAWSSELHGFRPIPSAGFVLDGVRG